ncbi:MAG: (2Fe-2S)-binding protein [Anaerolineae bacterium]|jgi:formate dehydrogenase major subunit/formate dehydrogenase alpha subunit|nr:(2Fe-2S)-binding protein [Anaerolineae bacterium]
MITLKIDGKTVEVPENTTVLRAAEAAGITIPTLCDHPDLTPYGGCRLCVVEVKGYRLPMASCALPVSQDMEVITENPALAEARRGILELLLSDYYDQGYEDGLGGSNELLHWAEHYHIDLEQAMAKQPRYRVDSDPNPFVWVDMNKCILCTRCIRACADVQGRFVWSLAARGAHTQVVAGAGTTMLDARCESCGACVAYCPTGALNNKMSLHLGAADRKVTTTCTYCGVGCQLELNVKDDKVIRVTSNSDAAVNGMRLCVKGRYGYDFIHHPDRLTQPQVRKYLLDGTPRPPGRGEWVTVDWDTALDLTAAKLSACRDIYGSNSLGILCSAKCLNEENYLFNKFARQVIGTNNIDHCARL